MFYVLIANKRTLNEKLLQFENPMGFAETLEYLRANYPSFTYQEAWEAKTTKLRLAA